MIPARLAGIRRPLLIGPFRGAIVWALVGPIIAIIPALGTILVGASTIRRVVALRWLVRVPARVAVGISARVLVGVAARWIVALRRKIPLRWVISPLWIVSLWRIIALWVIALLVIPLRIVALRRVVP